MHKLPRFIPNGARKVETPADLPVEVYLYEREDRINALAFRGKKTTPAFNYRFRSADHRNEYVTKWISDISEIEKYKAEEKAKRAAEKKAWRHGYKVGDILHSSWGYEQTNVEFYEIVAVSEKQVTFREISQRRERTGHDSGRAYPLKGRFLNEKVFTRTVQFTGAKDKGSVSFSEYPGGTARHLFFTENESCYFSDGY